MICCNGSIIVGDVIRIVFDCNLCILNLKRDVFIQTKSLNFAELLCWPIIAYSIKKQNKLTLRASMLLEKFTMFPRFVAMAASLLAISSALFSTVTYVF